MKKLLTVGSLSALIVGTAIPAHAATFASLAGASVTWAQTTGATAPGGSLVSSGDNVFSFLVSGLPTGLAGALELTSVQESETDAQTGVVFGTTAYQQTGITGHFNEVYEGATETVDGVHLVHGVTSLVSGDLTDGTITAIQGAPSSHLTFTSTDFVSPLIHLSGADSLDITIALGSGNWGVSSRRYNRTVYSTLKSFTGTASGNFLSAGVAEPADWALMLSGVCLTGGALRRRRMAGLAA
jgi:hypothetical protein